MCVDCGNNGWVPVDMIEILPENIKNRPIKDEWDLHQSMSFLNVWAGPPGTQNVTICRCRSGARPTPCWWKDGVCQDRSEEDRRSY